MIPRLLRLAGCLAPGGILLVVTWSAAFADAPAPDPDRPLRWGTPDVKGAEVDESRIGAEIVVDPAGAPSSESVPTLTLAFARARETLGRGIATRILIKPGVYREAVGNPGIDEGTAAETLLVLQGERPGAVVWTGADVFSFRGWEDLGDGLFAHAWSHRFGNVSPDWGPPGLLGHRSEMVFIGDRAYRQVILDEYEVKGIGQSLSRLEKETEPTWIYQRTLDPRATLKPGEFGVIEHGEQAGRIYVRLAPGETLPADGVEVSVRQNLVDFGKRGNVVLRNLVITRVANNLSRSPASKTLAFGEMAEFAPRHVVIENCHFLWNNSTAFNLFGQGWTIRDSRFDYNGGLGLWSWGASEMLWERNTTSYNGWRVWRGGEIAWFSGGVKLHYTRRHWVRGHTSIGNVSTGFHYDIACRDVWNEDLVLIDNAPGQLVYELGLGPFRARRILAVGGSYNGGTALRIWEAQEALVQDSIFYSNFGGEAWPKAEPAVMADISISGRKDRHARIDPVSGSTVLVETSLLAVGGRQPHLLRINDKRKEIVAEGSLKWFSHELVFGVPGRSDQGRFVRRVAGSSELMDFAQWKRTVTDQGSVVGAQALRDRSAGDYRLTADAIRASWAARLPSYVMPEAERKARDAFFAWIGYNPAEGSLVAPDRRPGAERGRVDPVN